ncbi:MAG: archease [Anaerolineales bacterium]|nr:archease [Anaerolineales bacterium]
MPTFSATDCNYEEIGHPTEVGLRLEADTAADLFICAAQAMFHLIQPEHIPSTKTTEWQQITLSANDPESLLVAWLDELLDLYHKTGLIYHRYSLVTWEPTFLEATVTGDKPAKPPTRQIRAATYRQLELTQTPTNWQARILFDSAP